MKSNVAVTTLPLFIDDRRWLGVPEDFFRRSCLPYTIPSQANYLSRWLSEAYDLSQDDAGQQLRRGSQAGLASVGRSH